MIIQAISYGGVKEEPFAFTYSGDFTDNRVDGVGTVRLNTSGTLTVTGKAVTVTATIVGGGGGGALCNNSREMCASGGGGGIQTVEVTLKAGAYDIVIGTGGAASNKTSNATGGNGGDTIAFEKTSTGGTGGKGGYGSYNAAGVGGTPNGGNGAIGIESGGTPNGGAVTTRGAQAGGDGYVELTFI